MNKVILIGNVGNDPEFKTLPSGDLVASFSLATSESWTDRSGEKKQATEWHSVQVFGKVAEVVRKFVSKGRKLCIEGKIKTRSWDNNGEKRYKTEVHAANVELLDRPPEASASSGKSEPRPSRPAAPQGNNEPEFFDDEVPF